MSAPQRTYWRSVALGEPYRRGWAQVRHVLTGAKDARTVADRSTANLICSRTTDGRHMPVLDLDVPHRLEPSSRPGHAHLYLDVPMRWHRYVVLLLALRWCRVIERGFLLYSLRRGATFVRLPHVKKPGYVQRVPADQAAVDAAAAATKLTAEEWYAVWELGAQFGRQCAGRLAPEEPIGTGYLGDVEP